MEKLLTFTTFLFEKLSEPSTQKGIVLICALTGYQLDPTLLPQIVSAYVAVHGLIEIIKKERK